LQEFPPGTKRRVEIGRRAIAIFNTSGRLYALRDVCPHQGAPLSRGVVLGQVRASAPGDYEYDPDCKYVRCPWHGWEYNLETGQSSYDPEHDRVRSYSVTVEHGANLQGDAGGAAEGSERRPGPYVAETFPVSVENDYVVVEM
jgi:3-phenylpropionate/trans-cinnamate dioxygenase ferredoxin subunit